VRSGSKVSVFDTVYGQALVSITDSIGLEDFGSVEVVYKGISSGPIAVNDVTINSAVAIGDMVDWVLKYMSQDKSVPEGYSYLPDNRL